MTERRLRAVLYDFDGTLADTTELVMSCYRHTMSTHLGHVPPEEDWLRGFGTPLEGQIERYARSPEERNAMITTYQTFQEAHTHLHMIPFAGAMETVVELKRRGVALAIVTSRHRESTLRGMDLCGLTDHFDLIVTPEDVTHPKPHPEPVQFALERLGLHPHEALFVGDSPHDMAAGRAAGTRTAAALWGPFPHEALEAERPDFFLESQSDVLRLLDELG